MPVESASLPTSGREAAVPQATIKIVSKILKCLSIFRKICQRPRVLGVIVSGSGISWTLVGKLYYLEVDTHAH